MKKWIMVLLILLTVLTFGAVRADDLADVMQNGVLRMGTAPEYVPFVFYDENDELTGIDVALIEEIARRMGVRLQTVDIAFDGLLNALEIGQVNIIGRGMSKTESRMERIDFSRVYYRGDAQFIALSSLPRPEIVDHNSFKGLKIGVQKATSFEQWIRDNLISDGSVDLKNVFLYANAEDLVKALDRKDVDLIVLDEDIYQSLYSPTGKYQVYYKGFLEENYAFGLQKGSTLTEVINKHLLDMMKDGTAQKIAEGFFSRNYTQAAAPEIVRPTPAPTAMPYIPPIVVPTQAPAPVACINSMTFVADVTISDGQQVSPGEYFRKIWRVYNNGTCTWTPSYSFVYVSGNQMSGNNISIPMNVAPGQTVDLAVDFIAPNAPATYKGYWQMRAPQGTNFGETIWVKVRVPGSQPQPVYPTPTPEEGQHFVPISISSFYPDSYEGYSESCVTVYWSTKGAASVEILVDGASVYQWDGPNGSRKICGQVRDIGSHNIQLHALNVVTDAWSSFTYTTIEHATGLIIPDDPYEDTGDQHATGLLFP